MDNTITNPDKQELRKFGLIFAGMFILFFGLLLPWIWEKVTFQNFEVLPTSVEISRTTPN